MPRATSQVCRNCGVLGHAVRDCPCYVCGLQGHFAKNCPSKATVGAGRTRRVPGRAQRPGGQRAGPVVPSKFDSAQLHQAHSEGASLSRTPLHLMSLLMLRDLRKGAPQDELDCGARDRHPVMARDLLAVLAGRSLAQQALREGLADGRHPPRPGCRLPSCARPACRRCACPGLWATASTRELGASAKPAGTSV
jgi:hypothetical protein